METVIFGAAVFVGWLTIDNKMIRTVSSDIDLTPEALQVSLDKSRGINKVNENFRIFYSILNNCFEVHYG